MNAYHSLSRVISIFAGITALTIIIAIPAGYFAVAYDYTSENLQSEAELSADLVSQVIYANPTLWQFEEHRLAGLLLHRQTRTHTDLRRIIGLSGNTIATAGPRVAAPVLVRSAYLTDGVNRVGRVEIHESLRTVILRTGLAGLVGMLLGLAVYLGLRVLPLRALMAVVKRLDESQESLRAEISEKELALKRAEDMGSIMRYQALHDSLTSLPNRILLHDRLQQAIQFSLREHKLLGLIMMDLNEFKEINDTLGHSIGDLVLQETAARLQSLLRGSDTVARLGGDEFAILLTSIKTDGSAVYTAHKILEALRQPFSADRHIFPISASLGIALFPEHGESAEGLLRCADVAMYSAKRKKIGFAIYDAELDKTNTKHIVLQNDLRHAIENNELVLHYQPKIDLITNCVCGVEALIRWNHPTRGLLFPNDFIPLAEQNGLIKPITEYVLRMALRQCEDWHSKDLNISIAINVSAVNLQDPLFPPRVFKIIDEYKVAPALLEMEITETAIMIDPLCAIESINKLRGFGITISIDDFGTGYSSMAYLKKLLVSKIKIDKSFVIDMLNNENDAVIVRSTIDLAHNLGLTVIAEGVEDEATWNRLKALGCDTAQGFYMSRPISSDKLAEWLEDSTWGIKRTVKENL